MMGLLSKGREILREPALFKEQLTALLADEGLRAAIARVAKSSIGDEREKILSDLRIKSLGGASGAGAIENRS